MNEALSQPQPPGYTITAVGCGGTATADVTVTVEEAPPAVIISASPANIVLGDSTLLSWDSKKVTGVHIDNSIGPVTLTGSQSVTPTYTIRRRCRRARIL